ncbi:MAG: DUF4129 domain-containing protein [bacterium]|nr:DUF4129 domain-containing protein [bacterium]
MKEREDMVKRERNKRVYIIPVLVFLFLFPLYGTPPENRAPARVRMPAEKDLETYRSRPEFRYDDKEKPPNTILEELWFRFKKKIEKLFRGGEESGVWNIIKYCIMGAVIILVIFILIKSDFKWFMFRKKKILEPESAEYREIYEDIRKIDFDTLIEEQAQNEDYRKAVRLCYNRSLQELLEKELIAWERDKTNTDYLREMKDSKDPELTNDFREITRIFEYSWYGFFSIDLILFSKIKKQFDNFSRRVSSL